MERERLLFDQKLQEQRRLLERQNSQLMEQHTLDKELLRENQLKTERETN